MTRTAARVATHQSDGSRHSRPDCPTAAHWYFEIDPVGRTGAENMTADFGLLREAAASAAGFLRLYRWTPPCLSFGRNEPARTRYDIAKIRSLGLDTVRRPTGGRAVWHDDEVTYAVAAPVAAAGGLRESYLRIHEMIAKALTLLGIRAFITERTEPGALRLSAGACFASPARGEIAVEGRKLVGSAQVREGAAFLQHGSILIKNHQNVVADVAKGSYIAPHAISLEEALGRRVGFSEVTEAVRGAAEAAWAGRWTPVADYKRRAHPFRAVDFSDPAWTWHR